METPNGTTISLSLRMAKALSLARDGKLRDAQALISGERTIPDHPLELHALASLVTTEGDYLRALKLWELLLQREPHHAEARRMVDAIELWLSRPSWMRYWGLVAVTGVAMFFAGLFWIFASGGTTAPREPAAGYEAPISAPEAESRAVTERPTPTPTPAPVYQANPAPTVTFPGATGTQRKRSNPR